MIWRSRSRASVVADESDALEVLHRRACEINIGSVSHSTLR